MTTTAFFSVTHSIDP